MPRWTRREYLALSLGGALTAACSTSGGADAPQGQSPLVTGFTPLKDLAADKGLRFGSAIDAHQLSDARYIDIIKRECGALVAENSHKWYVIHPQPDVWNFEPGDALVDFARTNDLKMRGHTLIWHHPRWLPDWVNDYQFRNAAEAEAMLDDYIDRVASRYSPFLYSWDVINEAIDDETGEYRETSFSRAMGGPANVIAYCFNRAREYAPDATLAYNDYMSWESGNEKHRAGVLRLLEELKASGAPLDAIGMQSHSNYDMPNEFTADKQRAWRAFCDECVDLGLDIYLTEFDVNDTELGPDIEMRDELIASYTKDYLDLMLSYPQTKEVLMWGMVDSYSWLQGFLPREDDVLKRPTLYDENYAAKPMRDAVAAALRAAPERQPG